MPERTERTERRSRDRTVLQKRLETMPHYRLSISNRSGDMEFLLYGLKSVGDIVTLEATKI